MPWRVILGAIGSNFRTPSNTSGFKTQFDKKIREYTGLSDGYSLYVDIHIKQQILMQMEALGLMSAAEYQLQNGGSAIFHRLTPRGLQTVLAENVAVVPTDIKQ